MKWLRWKTSDRGRAKGRGRSRRRASIRVEGQADWSHTSLATSPPKLLTVILAAEAWGLSHMPLKPPKNHSLPTLALRSLFPSPQCPLHSHPRVSSSLSSPSLASCCGPGMRHFSSLKGGAWGLPCCEDQMVQRHGRVFWQGTEILAPDLVSVFGPTFSFPQWKGRTEGAGFGGQRSGLLNSH